MRSQWLKMRRRTFLGAALAGAAAGGSALVYGFSRNSSPWRFFTAEEGSAVEATCEQIIPADRDPGAREAGVANYIDIQLTRHFRKQQRLYRRGIALVQEASRRTYGKPFPDLAYAQQTAVLKEIEKSSGAFFNLILAHTFQGFYGDPRHGGNRNMASWKMVGLPCPPVRGRMHYGDDRGSV